jgi:anti-anti-sigma factor
MFDPSTLSMPLSASADRRGDAMVVVLDGELDLSARAVFDDLMEEVIDSDAERVYIDLRGLEFIDSTGIELLLMAMKTAEEQGFAIAYLPGDGHVWSLLESIGVADRIPIVDQNVLL